jgi:predicted nucleic acid-binding protein
MRAFLDSNILVYAFGADARSAAAYGLVENGGVISTQSLNEMANVLRRKHRWTWDEVRRATRAVIVNCPTIVVLDVELHQLGLRLAERYTLSVYDGMIAAAAVIADCDTLYSEDMHHGLVLDGRVRIVNPFATA